MRSMAVAVTPDGPRVQTGLVSASRPKSSPIEQPSAGLEALSRRAASLTVAGRPTGIVRRAVCRGAPGRSVGEVAWRGGRRAPWSWPACSARAHRPGRTSAIGLDRVVDGLTRPLFVTHAGDGSGRLFVVEQAGRIRIVETAPCANRPFLDLTDAGQKRRRAGPARARLPSRLRDQRPLLRRLHARARRCDGDRGVPRRADEPEPRRPARAACC